MKIAVVHNLGTGGAHRRLTAQVQVLGETAEVFEVCPSTASPVTPAPLVQPLSLVAERSRGFRKIAGRYADHRAVGRAWEAVWARACAEKPDVIFANPCQFAMTPPHLATATVPVVFYCEEARRVDYDPQVRATRSLRGNVLYGPLYRAERSSDRAGVEAATRVVTNSAFTRSEIRRWYASDSEVIPPGVSDELLALSRRGAGARPTAGSSRYVLSVGSPSVNKRHDLVIAAASGLRDVSVLVALTRRDPRFEDLLRNQATRLGVELTIVTGLDDSQLYSVYRGALATCYLASNEPLGLVSLEAQACGCPVVVADSGGLPSTVVHGRTGWVVRTNSGETVRVLEALTTDDAMARDVSRAAAEHGARYTWQASVARLVHELRAAADPDAA